MGGGKKRKSRWTELNSFAEDDKIESVCAVSQDEWEVLEITMNQSQRTVETDFAVLWRQEPLRPRREKERSGDERPNGA